MFSDWLLPATILLTMLAMGCTLTKWDFLYLLKFPKAAITGLAVQLLGLPAIALVVASVAPLDLSAKMGIVLTAACPGGASAGLVAFLLGGNLALNIVITSVNSLITLFSIPMVMKLAASLLGTALGRKIHMPVQETVTYIFFTTVLPAALGIFLRQKWGPPVAQWAKRMKPVVAALMMLALLGVLFWEKDSEKLSLPVVLSLLPYMLTLNVLGLGAGLFFSRLLGLGTRNSVSITTEVGLQNTAMAIGLASSDLVFNDTSLGHPAAVYATFSFFTALAMAMWLRRRTVIAFVRRKWGKTLKQF
ncbi:MAG: hypothetical protein NZM65_04875 [Flavobacteriales bacterium]|nr:hypothetical protein [Flavobacteriales bacterium]MDW8410004.1 hypothetical protein [Flavobacteriales bacterium]